MRAPFPANEEQRLAKLLSYNILGTEVETAYDDLALLAAHLCQTPIALVSLIDADRQWFKSKVGLDTQETHRDLAFCAHAILDSDILVVPNARQDARFADNPLVTSAPYIQFYAGVPLITSDDFALGTLCVIDTQPRQLSDQQIEALKALSRQVINQLELRLKMQQLTQEIDKRKQIEAALVEREQQLKQRIAAIEAAVDGIAILPDGNHFSYLNQAYVKILGYDSAEELLGQNWRMLHSPQERQRLEQEMLPLLAKQGYWRGECMTRRKDGNEFYREVAMTQTEIGLICVSKDISERKQSEAELRQQRDLHNAVFNGSADAIFLVDPTTLLITGCNSRAVELFEASSIEQLIGIEGHTLQRQPFTAEELNEIEAEIQTKGFWCREVEYVTLKGNSFWGNLAAKPIQVADQVFYLVRVTDISDRKQAEIELKQAKEAAEAASLAKSVFLSKMSHELRTPLTAILGFTELMTGDTLLSRESRQHLEIISRSGNHLLNLINAVLEMSKIEAGELTLEETSVDLYSLLATVEDLLQLKAIHKSLKFVFERSSDVPRYIQTDENKLRQVLINLLDNAIKFTDAGSVTLRVRLASRNSSDRSIATRPHLSAADRLQFSVEDTGPGITSKEIDELFQPFSQTQTGRQSQEGTGLGLAISQQFVQLMGGEIIVESLPAQGMRFAFEIPLKQADAAQLDRLDAMKQRVIGLAANQSTKRILIVDDQLETCQILTKVLTPLGFEVQEATNGQEAVRMWAAWHPDLIWMDIKMPDIDGCQVTQRIRILEEFYTVPPSQRTVIIALTANAFEEERKIALAAGCDDFVSKPFQSEVILEKMAEHLSLRYVYAGEQESTNLSAVISPIGPNSSQPSNKLDLTFMSTEWLDQLQVAAARLNYSQCLMLIEQIPPEYAAIADFLAELIDAFQFDVLLKLIS